MHNLQQDDEGEKTELVADLSELRLFANTIFKQCAGVSGWISLRAFEHDGQGSAVVNRWEPFGGTVVKVAADVASAVANRPFPRRAVFSPPVCVFGDLGVSAGKRVASEPNVVCAPVIAVELDERPTASLAVLEAVLGEATVIVASGGRWIDENSQTQDKLHAYWRLRVPASTTEDRATLRRARSFAARLVGADTSAVPLNHPMRWPGSWHTKTTDARLCRIIGGNPRKDVELPWALHALETALSEAGLEASASGGGQHRERLGFKTKREWSGEELAEAARLIPNDGLSWDRWNTIGMSFWDASHASVEGLDAFHAWSEKDSRYDPEATDARWSHWSSSPPSNLSDGTLRHEMRKADPASSRIDVASVFEHLSTSIETGGPADIFGHADPAELGTPPAGSLPAVLERWAMSEARRKGVPVAFAAASAVTAAAAAIGSSLRLQARLFDTGWTEPAGLFTAIVADPGSTKSAIIRAAVEPLSDLNKKFMRDWKPRKAAWDAVAKLFKQGRKDAVDPGPEPICRRISFDNATSEKLVRMLADNPNGMICVPDELASALGQFGAYKRNGEGDRAQMLRMFDGDDITVDRVGGGTISADGALMSLLAGTQPDKLRSMTKDLGVDGLLQRFVFVIHDGLERRGLDEAPNAAIAADYRRILQSLAVAEYGFPDPLTMTAEAFRLIDEAAERIRSLKNLPATSTAFAGHLEKWGKLVRRLALTFHCVSEFDRCGAVNPSVQVSAETACQAVAFSYFLVRHSLAFYRTFTTAPDASSDACWIGEYLLTHRQLTQVTRRDLYSARKDFQGAGLPVLLAAMRVLEGAGWAEPFGEWKPDGPAAWTICPDVHVRFGDHADRARRERSVRQSKIIEAGLSRRLINGQGAEPAKQALTPVNVFD